MLDQVTSSRVGAEFIGLARALRTEVRAVDLALDKGLAVITAPLRERLARHPKLRHETVTGVAREYALLIPSLFRIGTIRAARDRCEFSITETRVCVSWLTCDAWSDPEQREQGLSICQFTLAVQDGRLHQRWRPVVTVSLHALGRRIERGRGRDHVALLRDLAVLAEAGEGGERVETADGFWLGGLCGAMDGARVVRLRNVRTWISSA